MYRDQDFDQQRTLPVNEPALMQDLELGTLFGAMAGGDEFLLQVAKPAVLLSLQNDRETILYRQAVIQDCLRNCSIVKNLYDIAVEAMENRRKHWLWIIGHHASSILYDAVGMLEICVGALAKLRQVADVHADQFESEGFTAFFAMLKAELADEYLATVKDHLKKLRFREGVLLSAELGKGNEGTNYVLRLSRDKKPGWIERLLARKPPAYTYRLDPRDQAGARALSDLRDRGISLVANAAAQSAEHVLSFLVMLRTELAFYLGCVNLQRQLAQRGVPIRFPNPTPSGARRYSCVRLCDVCLALRLERSVIGNDVDADGKGLVLITGANQGGKSTFLRGVGVAQLMMQSGMFVAAESFRADICRSLFTHYKREEDATMESGRLDEELNRMSGIADALTPDSMLLLNESFAATNEREGSEIAKQIVCALLGRRVRVFFVTHLSEFARGLWDDETDGALFLRAEREVGGRRTFRLLPGEPLETSFGADVYEEVFGGATGRAGER